MQTQRSNAKKNNVHFRFGIIFILFLYLYFHRHRLIFCVSLGKLSGNTVAICRKCLNLGLNNCTIFRLCVCFSFLFFSLIISFFSCLFRFFTFFSSSLDQSECASERSRETESMHIFFSPFCLGSLRCHRANANFRPWEYFTM